MLLKAKLRLCSVKGCTCINDSINAWSSAEHQLHHPSQVMHLSRWESWPCTGLLSYGSNALFLLADQGLGGEAAAWAPPQAPVDGAVRQGASGGQCQPQLAKAELGLEAAVTFASRTPGAHVETWHGVLRASSHSAP